MKNRIFGLLLSVLLIAGLSPAIAAFAADDVSGDIKIDGIRVEGNVRVTVGDILSRMKIRAGDTINKDRVKADCEAVLTLAKFSEVKPEITNENGKVILLMRVKENPVITVVNFEGNTIFTDERLRSVMKTQPGNVLDTALLREDIAAIEKLYQDAGYVLARVVDVNVTPEGVVTLTIAEGVIEDIRVEGLQKTRAFVVTRELLVKPGDVFERDRVRRSLQRVFNLGFFEDVTSRVEPGAKPGQVILVVKVVERKTGTASAGLGYSSKEGLVGSLEVSDVNFRGVGQRASARLEFGTKQSYELSFREPWLDKHNTSLDVSLYDTTKERFRETDDKFTETRKGGSLALGRPLSEYVRTSLAYRAEDVSITDNTSNLPEGPLRSLEWVTVRDTRDVFTSATSGSRVSFSAMKAGGWLGGDFDFNKYILDGRRYIRLSRQNHVLALRFNAGLGTGDIPTYEQFTLGGAFTLRGFEEDSLRGNNVLSATAEYRVPVNKNLAGVLFVDAGKVWGQTVPLADEGDIKLGYGAGIRVETPIGPIRLDYGIGEAGGRVHFSIGQMF
ncbi:MAG: outer membrane protein assembly factor [bacterium]|nr:outer membrane protein assembly factor [bacterium]